MKFIVYGYKNNQKVINMYGGYLTENKISDGQLLKVNLNNFVFIAKVYMTELKFKKSISKVGRITIPKNVVDYLKLKNKQEVNVEILK